MECLKKKYRNEVVELETELRKQYEITHSMKSEVEGLKRLMDEYISDAENGEKGGGRAGEGEIKEVGVEKEKEGESGNKKQDNSPIKSMTEERPPTLEIII